MPEEKNMLIKEISLDKEIPLDTDKAAEGEIQKFFNMPSSSIVKDTASIMANANTLGELPEARKKTRSKTYLVYSNEGNDTKVISAFAKKDLQYSIGLADFTETFKKASNKGLIKIYIFTLTQIFEQCFQDNKHIELPPDAVQAVFIGYDKMVEAGLYNTKNIARDNFARNYEKLMHLHYSGKATKKKQAKDYIALFTGGIKEKNGYSLILNQLIDWNAIAPFYAVIPSWIFKLSNIAFQTALYIFYLARQNSQEIAEKGSFDISLRALKGQLALPDENGITDPKKLIKTPIEEAIQEINAEAKTPDFKVKMTPKFKGNERITEYLDKGKLHITISGEYASSYKKIDEHAKKKIEANKKKTETNKKKKSEK